MTADGRRPSKAGAPPVNAPVANESANPRFLILMCTHNGARFLDTQLASLESQTYPAQAVVIHDWASADATTDRLRHFQSTCSGRLEVSIVEHGSAPGPAASFLAAMRCVLAQRDDFDFLLFCDQDDVWHPQKLERFAAVLHQQPDLDLLYSEVELIDEQGRVTASCHLRRRGGRDAPQDLAHASTLFVNVVPGMAMGVSARFLRRNSTAWAAEGWFMHDWAMCIVAHLTGARAAFVEQSLVGYRQHGANQLGATARRAWHAPMSFGRAKAYAAAVKRQYRLCASLSLQRIGRSVVREPEALEVALTIIRGRMLPPLQRLRVALGLGLMWPRGD